MKNFNKKEDSTHKDYSEQLNSIEESVYKLLINSGLASKELEEERAEPEQESSRLGEGTMFSSPSLRFTTDWTLKILMQLSIKYKTACRKIFENGGWWYDWTYL